MIYGNRYVKFIFFSVFLLVLIMIISFYYNIFSIKHDLDYIYLNNKRNDLFVVGLKSGNNYGVFSKDDNTYYFSENLFNYENLEIISPYHTDYSLNKISNFEYKIFIYSDKYFQEKIIKIVDIPIINIITNSVINNRIHYNIFNTKYNLLINNDETLNEYTDINLIVSDNNYDVHNSSSQTLYLTGGIRVRGATSLNFPKKSYKIQLNQKKSLLGMNADDDWILDALYTDKSKIRNKLSYDIWNQINNNQEIDNELIGNFVEVFIDDQYIGLYVLKEKIDKDIVSISDEGFLAKSISHVSEKDVNSLIYGNFAIDANNILLNYELKNYTSHSLKSFIHIMQEYYLSNKDDDVIRNIFDLNNYVNYKVFLSLVSGVDNVTKNQYVSMQDEDSKILITPWDLDLTWGLDYSDQTELYSLDKFYNYSDKKWLDDNILDENSGEINLLIKQRYWELRENVITMDVINEYLDSYKELLVSSGAAKRDSDRWYYYDIENEIEKIRVWANNRIQFLDEYFKL